MAGLWSTAWPSPLQISPQGHRVKKRVRLFQCCSIEPNGKNNITKAPQLLQIAVGGVTELLRFFSFISRDRAFLADNEWKDEITVSNVNDVLSIIKSDYEKAYFVTGLFTSAIYAEDCTFEDPTIKFRGKRLYANNLSLLVPFFDNPSIQLKKILKDIDSESEFISASWKLRTFLKLPWKPLISIDGKTTYYLDEDFRIIRHVEKWNISAVQAIIQIFTPSFRRSDD